jgi:uncharacterized protein YceK
MRSFIITFGLCVGLMISGCAKTRKDSSEAKAEATSLHAPATAKPGSHEDWCQEHQVPESQCTLCNPSLVAAFKATNDWCEEHGLPESHCRKCNPNLKITRPPKAN